MGGLTNVAVKPLILAVVVSVGLGTLYTLKAHISLDYSGGVKDVTPQATAQVTTPLNNQGGDKLDIDSEAKKTLNKMILLKKTILITFVNDGFMPMAHSWLCNTMYMGIHDQILLFATDLKSNEELAKFWPRLNVVNMAEESLSGNQSFQHAGYLRLMAKRTRWIQWMLKNSVEFLLFEFDFIWFSNPLPVLQSKCEGSDMLLIHVALHPAEACGCFIYMKPTEKTIGLWNELTRMMNNLDNKLKKFKDNQGVNFYENDQSFLTHLAAKKFGGIRIAWLPYEMFPDGKWFEMKEDARVKKFKPLILHNNWIVGNQPKIDRAKRFNLWFWDSKSKTCNTDLAKHYTSPNFTHAMIHKIYPKPTTKS